MIRSGDAGVRENPEPGCKKKKNQDVSVMQEHCKITSSYYAAQVLEQINLAHKTIPLLTSFVSLAIF